MKPASDPATPPESKNKYLKRGSFSRTQLLAFALVFAAIGGYVLYRSFAAAPLIASLQGEQMSLPSGSKVVTDTSASGGKALELVSTASSTTAPTAKPVIPTGLAATAGNGSVTLNWNANPASDQVNTYQVYYGTVSSFSSFSTFIDNIATTSYTVGGLTNGKTYYFKVSAHNSVGYGPWSASPVAGTPTTGTPPPSTTNLALHKPATASSVEPAPYSVVAANAFDGNSTSRWSSAFSDPQWLQVDLGSAQSISSVVISWETAYAKAFQIQTSNDAKTWTTVYSTTSNTGGTQTLTVSGSGRYVRMYGTQRATKWGYSIFEMGVYGPGTGGTGTGSGSGGSTAGSPVTTTGSVNFPSSVTSLTVTARGDQCSGSPQMNVIVDGTALISAASVSSTSWSSFSANTSLNSGNHTLAITLANPLLSATCGRNLYIDVSNFYGPNVVTPTPTVSLSASPSSVTAGSAATLTWNSANATSCTASGAWSGSEATSGSVSTGALNQSSTYTLTCTGPGGSASASANVTVTTSGGGSSMVHGMYDSDGTQAAFTADWPAIAAQDINTLILPSEWTSNLQTLKAAGDKAWVTAGYWDDASQSFSLSQAQAVSDVSSACALGVVSGIYVADEPSAGQATIKARAAALKAACPSAQTTMAYYDAATVGNWKGVTDTISLDIYPSRSGFNNSLITQLAAAADAAGIPYYGVVGAFTDGTANYPLPTAAQLSAMFSAWESTHELGWLVYSWGATGGASSTQLQNQPSLLSVIKSNADK